MPVFHGEAALGGWGRVVEEVHAGGGRIAPQLWHVGAMKNPMLPDHPHAAEGPSGLLRPGKEYGTAMTDADIADTIRAFAEAAADAVRLGFDAVELHGAHGYLLDQFFWDGTNVRDDGWNGGLPERARFAAHIVKAVKAAIGATPLILRLSQWKQQDFTVKLAPTPDAMAAWLTPLADAGVDVFHCSQRRFWEAEFAEVDGADGLNFAGWAKKLTGRPTITVGSVGLSGEFVAGFGGETSQPASLNNLLDPFGPRRVRPRRRRPRADRRPRLGGEGPRRADGRAEGLRPRRAGDAGVESRPVRGRPTGCFRGLYEVGSRRLCVVARRRGQDHEDHRVQDRVRP